MKSTLIGAVISVVFLAALFVSWHLWVAAFVAEWVR